MRCRTEAVGHLLDVYERLDEKVAEIQAFRLQPLGRAAAVGAQPPAEYAPGSDPRSDQSEQTQLVLGLVKPLLLATQTVPTIPE